MKRVISLALIANESGLTITINGFESRTARVERNTEEKYKSDGGKEYPIKTHAFASPISLSIACQTLDICFD
jgi:hypothetical protein